ncbi:hypothetical protein [Streptomyces cadmiisoli]
MDAAADRAHHQRGRIGDPARARELGPAPADPGQLAQTLSS